MCVAISALEWGEGPSRELRARAGHVILSGAMNPHWFRDSLPMHTVRSGRAVVPRRPESSDESQ